MPWTELLGHADRIEELRRSIARGRLGHTYVFVGPGGVGKRTFALQLARCLFCERHAETELESCGECSGCKQVAAGTHPDLVVVGLPKGKSELPIDLFLGEDDRRGKEGLCHDLSLKPMSSRRKVAIINDADYFNDASGNALLKTLEEPPPKSVIILIATSADLLLPTIRSRCQAVRFGPLEESLVRQLLLSEGLTESEQEAAEIAGLCEGSLDMARQLLDPQLRAQRGVLYDLLAAEKFDSVQLSAKMIAGLKEVGGEKADLREHAGWIARFCIEFYRRALLTLSGDAADGGGIAQVSRFVSRFAGRTLDDIDRVVDLLERSIVAEQQFDSNAHMELCMEAFFDDLGRIGRGK